MSTNDNLYARRYTQVNGERRQTNASDGTLISKGFAGKEAAEERKKVDWERVMAKYTRRIFLEEKYKTSTTSVTTSNAGQPNARTEEDNYFDTYEEGGIEMGGGGQREANNPPSSNMLRNVNGNASIPLVVVLDQRACTTNLTKLLAEHRQLHTAAFLAAHQNKRKQLVMKIVDALIKRGAVVPFSDLAPEDGSAGASEGQYVALCVADDEDLIVPSNSILGLKRDREEKESAEAMARAASRGSRTEGGNHTVSPNEFPSTIADDLALVFGGMGHQSASVGHISAEAARFMGGTAGTAAGKGGALTPGGAAQARMIPRTVVVKKQQQQLAALTARQPQPSAPAASAQTIPSPAPPLPAAKLTGDDELDDFLSEL